MLLTSPLAAQPSVQNATTTANCGRRDKTKVVLGT